MYNVIVRILVLALLLVFAVGFLLLRDRDTQSVNSTGLNSNNKYHNQEIARYVFVPYWTFSDRISLRENESAIYFGVTYNNSGINREEDGYRKLSSFVNSIPPGKEKYLTLRILGEDADGEFLENSRLQAVIGEDLAKVAKEFGFNGVVIDYETSAFGFASTENKITSMYKILYEEIKNEDLEFFVTVFGDSYYRARPYNLKEINNIADKVIIMAYDFHKARLNPGPNFSLSDRVKYGYDLEVMIEDFSKDLNSDKVVVALGYFGYDWKMEGGVNLGMAEPLSLNQIISRYVNNCPNGSCAVQQNDDEESVIKYVDSEGFSHEVWYESEASANKKIEFLSDTGINQIAIWAYSYY